MDIIVLGLQPCTVSKESISRILFHKHSKSSILELYTMGHDSLVYVTITFLSFVA